MLADLAAMREGLTSVPIHVVLGKCSSLLHESDNSDIKEHIFMLELVHIRNK